MSEALYNSKNKNTNKCQNAKRQGMVGHNEGKPLMRLIKSLTGIKDREQSIVLTNSGLIEILQNEFNLHAKDLHKLELNIYIDVLKKYLKDWPKWNDLGAIVAEKKNNDYEEVKNILNREYYSLKQYLDAVIDVTKPLAEKAAQAVEMENHKQQLTNERDNNDDDEVVMEVNCTHNQLTQLFCRAPDPKRMNTIFNIKPTQPSVITLNTFTLDSILSWLQVSLQINLTTFLFKSNNKFKLEHTLLNKALKRNYRRPPIPLDVSSLLIKPKMKNQERQCSMKQMINVVDNCNRFIKSKYPHHDRYITSIFDFVRWCLTLMHEEIKFPANYRKYFNNYAYVRYLYSDKAPKNLEGNIKFDVQLEEKLSPLQEFYVGKATSGPIAFMGSEPWLKIECLLCTVAFYGVEDLDSLINHFMECHQYEQDWQCSHCNLVFSMSYLASKRWKHVC